MFPNVSSERTYPNTCPCNPPATLHQTSWLRSYAGVLHGTDQGNLDTSTYGVLEGMLEGEGVPYCSTLSGSFCHLWHCRKHWQWQYHLGFMFFLMGAKLPAAADWLFHDFRADNDTLLGPQVFSILCRYSCSKSLSCIFHPGFLGHYNTIPTHHPFDRCVENSSFWRKTAL